MFISKGHYRDILARLTRLEKTTMEVEMRTAFFTPHSLEGRFGTISFPCFLGCTLEYSGIYIDIKTVFNLILDKLHLKIQRIEKKEPQVKLIDIEEQH